MSKIQRLRSVEPQQFRPAKWKLGRQENYEKEIDPLNHSNFAPRSGNFPLIQVRSGDGGKLNHSNFGPRSGFWSAALQCRFGPNPDNLKRWTGISGNGRREKELRKRCYSTALQKQWQFRPSKWKRIGDNNHEGGIVKLNYSNFAPRREFLECGTVVPL